MHKKTIAIHAVRIYNQSMQDSFNRSSLLCSSLVPGIVTCRNNSSVAIVIASMHINSSYIGGVFRGVSCMHARYVLQTLYEGQLYIASYSIDLKDLAIIDRLKLVVYVAS